MPAPTPHPAATDPAHPDGPGAHVDVVVVGGGLAGLTAAAVASRAGRSVSIVPGPAPAGRATTDERDGFLLNRGPHATYRGGAGAAVLGRLGIRPDGAAPPTGGLLVRRDEELPIPTGAWSGLRTHLLGGADKVRLVRVLARIARTDPASVADLTVDEWLARHVEGDLADLVRTAVRIGTYAADTDVLPADVAVTQLRGAAKGVRYLHGGWATLAQALRDAAPDVTTVPGRAVAVRASAAGGVHVELSTGALHARAAVVAVGSPAAAADLLGAPGPAWEALGPPVTASCLDLGLRQPPPTPVVFGIDRPWYLVAHAPAARLAPEGRAVVHAMRNHRHGEDLAPDRVHDELRALARRAGVGEGDVVVERYLHRMVVVSATPTVAGGGLAGRPPVDATGAPGVFVAGDWVGPTGFLADASLASGEEAGKEAAWHAAPTRSGARSVPA